MTATTLLMFCSSGVAARPARCFDVPSAWRNPFTDCLRPPLHRPRGSGPSRPVPDVRDGPGRAGTGRTCGTGAGVAAVPGARRGGRSGHVPEQAVVGEALLVRGDPVRVVHDA